MSSSTVPSAAWASDQDVWPSLKQAIANSSGFGRWQSLKQASDTPLSDNLDEQVRRYLRETLATLAY
ncbi:hypothetical protein PN441_03795 [Spirulina major CS-329]|jgi:hypothetical protein|uniref:hypothetical protein n=1 Tax=Spirulina TaxID=1154 RepID=UPI0009345DC5|nr:MULTISPECIES: hypothetical protein [Spirulina]MDB9495155.1 hypothetical protein [Spirulina subsalsa CS-330]MDB9502181.1 hypothetical protein [Spirulina major CS-329]